MQRRHDNIMQRSSMAKQLAMTSSTGPSTSGRTETQAETEDSSLNNFEAQRQSMVIRRVWGTKVYATPDE